MARQNKIIKIITEKKIELGFEPSMKTLLRILKTMIKNGPKGKTSLSLDANLNYARLAKHIVWLQKKGLVKSTIKGTKINISLTEKGKIFFSMISDTK